MDGREKYGGLAAGAISEGEAMRRDDAEAYGCLFCMTGKERVVAERIQQEHPEVRAITARQEKHKSVRGKKMKVEAIMLPGYVFFRAPINMRPASCFPSEGVLRILAMDDGVWQLTGSDEQFVHWLFECDGLLGFSKAHKVGDQIRMLNGPLKDMEGQIVRVDKRGRSGQVLLQFNGRSVPVWLGFDLIQAQTDSKRG